MTRATDRARAPVPPAQGAGRGAGAAQARRSRPRRGVVLRAVRRRAAEDRDRQPRQPRRPGPDQGRPVPRAQDARGVRLRLPDLAASARRCCTSASSTSSPAARTSSCSARPAPARRHLAIALGIRACLAGHRVAFRTATEWVALLADAQRQGRLDDELARLQRIPLLIVDEVGYIPFDPQAANLMFMLVSPPLRARLADRHLQQAVQRPGARSSATTSSPPR